MFLNTIFCFFACLREVLGFLHCYAYLNRSISFYRRKMAQATAPAASIHDEDSSESKMVVTFLMSALESMVSTGVGHSSGDTNIFHWGAGEG